MLDGTGGFSQTAVIEHRQHADAPAHKIGHKDAPSFFIDQDVAWVGPVRRPFVEELKPSRLRVHRKRADGPGRLVFKSLQFVDGVQETPGGIERQVRRVGGAGVLPTGSRAPDVWSRRKTYIPSPFPWRIFPVPKRIGSVYVPIYTSISFFIPHTPINYRHPGESRGPGPFSHTEKT